MLTLIDRVRLGCVPVVYRPRHVVGMPRRPDQLRSRFIATCAPWSMIPPGSHTPRWRWPSSWSRWPASSSCWPAWAQAWSRWRPVPEAQSVGQAW